jgi:hypothetical protein
MQAYRWIADSRVRLCFREHIMVDLYSPCDMTGLTRRGEKGETAERDEPVQVPHNL